MRKILPREDTAAPCRGSDDRGADRTVVERVRPLGGDQRQRPGKVGLHEPVALGERPPLRLEDVGGGGIACELGRLERHDTGIALTQNEAVARQPDRGRHQRRARQCAVAYAGSLQSQHRTRHADRLPAIGRPAGHHVPGLVLEHGGGRCARRLLAEVEEGRAVIGEMKRHEPPATDIAGLWIDDRERIPDRNRGIDGVAAIAQNLDADIGGKMLSADDHAARSGHRLGIRG